MKKLSFDNGVGIREAENWNDFLLFITSQLEYRHFVWRGQRDQLWKLESSLDRKLRTLNMLHDKEIRNTHLENFKYAIRGRRGANPRNITDENEWWALGQHNGLLTPLLDWTTSPFVAAFFSYIEKASSSTSYRMVFGISKNSIRNKSNEIRNIFQGSGRPPIIDFVEPLTDDNPRLVTQGGLFTRTPDGEDIESWIKKNFKGESEKVKMWKILLPETERETALQSLNRMNINYLSLFPDLFGASNHVNTDLEIEKY